MHAPDHIKISSEAYPNIFMMHTYMHAPDHIKISSQAYPNIYDAYYYACHEDELYINEASQGLLQQSMPNSYSLVATIQLRLNVAVPCTTHLGFTTIHS